MQKIKLLIIIFLCFKSFTFSQTTLHLDKIFLPPTQQEINDIYNSFSKDYSCPKFEIVENIYEDEEIVVNRIKYLSDNLWITGILAYPNKEGKFPLILLNHGGTAGLTKFDKDKIYELAEKGYVVLASTYRGQIGFAGKSEGEIEFLHGEVRDVLNLLECSKELKNVNKDKIGMLGGSYGGGITLLALSRTKDISCAVVWAGPADMLNNVIKNAILDYLNDPKKFKIYFSLVLAEGVGKIEEFMQNIISGKQNIEDARKELILRSPLYFIDKISTPLLLIYGEKDPLVSSDDARNLIKKLKEHNKIFDARIYPEQGHTILGKDKDEAEKLQDEFLSRCLTP